MHRARGSAGTVLFVLILAALLAGIIHGYRIYCDAYFIALYDGEMVRYIDIPPFARRLDSPTNDLKGRASLEVGVSRDHCDAFFEAMSRRRGFTFRGTDKPGEIEFKIGPDYAVRGVYTEERLDLRWTPILTEAQRARFREMFPGEPLPGAPDATP